MKWPKLMLMIRHDTSEYNVLRDLKARSALYQEFLRNFELNPNSNRTVSLAKKVSEKFALGVGDALTSLLDAEAKRAKKVGAVLKKEYAKEVPDVVFVSPYKRTWMTLEGLRYGWPELKDVKTVEDERIREQEHGLSLLYSDWRVFHVLHPEQAKLRRIEGSYWYRYPQGESVPDVRERNRSWINTIVRDFAEKRILVVTHHLNILAVRANLERWDAQKFIEIDKNDKPSNCSVTAYVGNPNKGKEGRFELAYYNRKLYEEI